MASNLTKKEKGFVNDIVEGSTGTDAALNNYNTKNENVAASIASQNLRKLKIQDALAELGFNAETAKGVVVDIMLDPEKDASSRLKATDQVFKVTGAYAPEKSINLNLNGDGIPNEELEALAQQLNDIARNHKRTGIGGDGHDTHAVDQEARD